MRHAANSGFLKNAREIQSDILIPRYYDPRIEADRATLARSHTLVTLGELVETGKLKHDHGNYIPKIYYGTGPYPYIRTSDLANWELKASPKHGIAKEVFDEYAGSQDVRPDDILFVHEGTYLIGSAAIVTCFDGPMLYQHHLAKFRALEGSPIGPYFLLAALQSPFVQRQIRSKQFSADIIDSVVGRMGEVTLAIPKDHRRLAAIESKIKGALLSRARVREKLSFLLREVDAWLRSTSAEGQLETLFGWEPSEKIYQGRPAFLGERAEFIAFVRRSNEVAGDVLMPKYYDPFAEDLIPAYAGRGRVVDIASLVSEGTLVLDTGDEIGKISYGTGSIPFLRTSDFGSYELKRDPKQGISREIWADWSRGQDLRAGDVLLVRDGTYLVGSSAMVAVDDLPMLYCAGIIKIRCTDTDMLPPSLLYALLNSPFVRRQMRNKQFTRDVIDTLGRRFEEVRLPVPREAAICRRIAEGVQALLTTRNEARSTVDRAIQEMYAGD